MKIDEKALQEIYQRLIDRDPTATADFFTVAYAGLVGYALSRHRQYGLDLDGAKDIAVEVIADLAERPERYNADKGSLLGYLFMCVNGDAINANQKRAEAYKKTSAHVVELRSLTGNPSIDDPGRSLDVRTIMNRHRDDIIKDPGDDIVFALILQDERDTDVYARELGLSDLPDDEKTHEVKRRKDRIDQRLSRLGKKL